MKKNYTGKMWLLFLFVAFMLFACKDKEGKDVHAATKELRVDSALASSAKPVNERVVATIPAISAESGMRILNLEALGIIGFDTRRQNSISSRVTGRIERLYIKYNYQPVKQGQLIMEIYSPDLAAAQRELLFVYRSGNRDLLQKAKQRLSFLGMQASQINVVLRTGNIFYRVPVYSNTNGYVLEKSATTSQAGTAAVMPSSLPAGTDGMTGMNGNSSQATLNPQLPVNVNSPVLIREGQYVSAGQSLFTLYDDKSLVAEFAFKPGYAAEIRKGGKLVFRTNADKDKVYTGTIGLIEPVVKSGQSFTLARVYLTNAALKPGQLIIANIAVTAKGWWLPRDAVWKSGTRSIVFKKENDVFVPVEIQTGMEAAGLVNVITPVNDWAIARNASFLVDSESFIKTKPLKN